MNPPNRTIYLALVVIWVILIGGFVGRHNFTSNSAKNFQSALPLLVLAAVVVTFLTISRLKYDLIRSHPMKVVEKAVKALPGEFQEITRIEGTADIKLNLRLTADATRGDEIYTLQVRNHKHYVVYKDKFCPGLKQHRSDHIFKKDDLPLTFVIRSDWGQEAVVDACVSYRETA